MKGGPAINIGTSGWHYGHWKGPFYPDDLRDAAMLEFYAARFGTVEINNSFYRMPGDNMLAEWRNAVPEGFVFAVEATRLFVRWL